METRTIDKDWLRNKYLQERLSTVEIAKLLNCGQPSVYRHLKKYNIPTRNSKSAAIDRKKKGFKNSLLRDREWLFDKYIVDKLNSYQIAELANSNQKSVLASLKFHNIKSRNISESKINQYNIEKHNKPLFKYCELNNKDWLKKKYVDEKLSSRVIGNIIGCRENLVCEALKEHGIKRRTNSESHKLLIIDSKYKLLNDKNWLSNKYLVEKKGTIEITKLAGAKQANSARQALIKFGIPMRSIGDGLTCNRRDDGFRLTNESLQVIEGSLLGDAFLRVWKKGSRQGNASLYKRNKFYDHVVFFGKGVFESEEKAKMMIKEERNSLTYKGVIKSFKYFHIRTYSHKELTPLYKKWYPESNGFKKLVPCDFELTPTSLLHWFMDDGCSFRRKREREYKNTRAKTILRQNHNQIIISFASESFSKEDNERLVKQMREKFNLNAKVNKYCKGTGWRIGISQSDAQKFFETIGLCPVPSMQYKWKLS